LVAALKHESIKREGKDAVDADFIKRAQDYQREEYGEPIGDWVYVFCCSS
jgi:hypothetical protein